MHQTCFARRARSWEMSLSPAPRSAIVPGASRAVVAAEAAGDEVEVLLRGAAALLEDPLEAPAVALDLGLVGHRLDRRTDERQLSGREV
jgi:hypothetical protein